MTGEPLLATEGLTVRFGGLTALDAVSLSVAPGCVHAVIGPNGSGKTTLLNALSGAHKPDAGSIRLQGVNLVGMKPNRRARLGLARTFQNIRLFGGLSALDNVKVGAAQQAAQSLWDVLSHSKKHHAVEAEITAIAHAALHTVGLSARADDAAKSLSYAQQRLLEIARALAAKPKLLLLDEPAAGMNMSESMTLLDTIAKLRATGLAILLVEHNVRLVMGISDHVTVLDFGRVIANGPPAAVQNDPAVVTAYLGRRRHAA